MKKPVKTLNRKEVEKIIYDCVMDNQEEYPVEGVLKKYADQICNLAIPEPKLISRSNISKPFDYKIKEGDK